MFMVSPALARNAEWFCPNCGKAGNKGDFCPDCGYGKPVDDILIFDDMQPNSPKNHCIGNIKNTDESTY